MVPIKDFPIAGMNLGTLRYKNIHNLLTFDVYLLHGEINRRHNLLGIINSRNKILFYLVNGSRINARDTAIIINPE